MKNENEELKALIGMLFLKIEELESKIDAKEVNINWIPQLPEPVYPVYPQYPQPLYPQPWQVGPTWISDTHGGTMM